MLQDPLTDLFKSLSSLYTEPRELAAIWLDKSVQTGTVRTLRIAPGALVRIENGQLVDGEPTHKVIGCYGTLYDQFELTVIDLETKEPGQIKL